MREEYELEVLGRYDIEVKGTRRIRGAFFCDTNEGTMLLKETKVSAQRAPLLYTVLRYIEDLGIVKVDTPVFTSDGELLVTSREGRVYMLKKWYQGHECDIRQEGELVQAAQKLAVLHRLTGNRRQWDANGTLTGEYTGVARDPAEEIRRHNRELKKVRAFIRQRTVKNEFEMLFLSSFESMYEMAEKVLDRMESAGLGELKKSAADTGSLIHGDYNYHNLLMTEDDMAVTGFERMHAGIQVQDLYYFTRKVMEKHHWKQKTGRKILDAYESERRLTPCEREYTGLCLAYPEKYWKTASSYYHSNKAWLPEKYVEKLKLAVRQAEEKYGFLEEVFSLRL